jgi:probable rRNA maturation factor
VAAVKSQVNCSSTSVIAGADSPIVAVYSTQKRFPISPSSAELLTRQVLSAEGALCDEVALHFVGKTTICRLHGTYFNDPSPTDCITFPLDKDESIGYRFLGEVFICPQAALRFAKKNDFDVLEEISLYVVHGLLHLLGYDDIEEKDRHLMRNREQYHMNLLKSKGILLKYNA